MSTSLEFFYNLNSSLQLMLIFLRKSVRKSEIWIPPFDEKQGALVQMKRMTFNFSRWPRWKSEKLKCFLLMFSFIHDLLFIIGYIDHFSYINFSNLFTSLSFVYLFICSFIHSLFLIYLLNRSARPWLYLYCIPRSFLNYSNNRKIEGA